jgi:hypothetical protein
MADQNIFAYFTSYDAAESTATKLKSNHVKYVNLSQGNERSFVGLSDGMLPVPTSPSMFGNNFAGPGANFSPWVAGVVGAQSLSDDGMGNDPLGNNDFLLEAVVSEEKYKQAVSIIEEGGGRL